MSKNIVKTVLMLLLAVVAVVFCIQLFDFAINYNKTSPVVGYIASPSDEPFLDLNLLEQEMSKQEISFITSQPGENAEAAARRMIDMGASVMIVGQDEHHVNKELLEITEKESVTILFVGHRPDQQDIEQSDKAWYIGSNAAHGGELLGKGAAEAYKNGVIVDVNGDHLMQTMVVGDSQLTQYALEESEHLGVYTQVVDYLDSEGKKLPLTVEAFNGQPKPEFILCDNGIQAREVRALAQQMGWLDGDAPVRIGCAAASKSYAQQLRQDGIVDLPVPYYDVTTVTQAVVSFAQNALEFRFVAEDTELVPNSEERFIIPYQLMQ